MLSGSKLAKGCIEVALCCAYITMYLSFKLQCDEDGADECNFEWDKTNVNPMPTSALIAFWFWMLTLVILDYTVPGRVGNPDGYSYLDMMKIGLLFLFFIWDCGLLHEAQEYTTIDDEMETSYKGVMVTRTLINLWIPCIVLSSSIFNIPAIPSSAKIKRVVWTCVMLVSCLLFLSYYVMILQTCKEAYQDDGWTRACGYAGVHTHVILYDGEKVGDLDMKDLYPPVWVYITIMVVSFVAFLVTCVPHPMTSKILLFGPVIFFNLCVQQLWCVIGETRAAMQSIEEDGSSLRLRISGESWGSNAQNSVVAGEVALWIFFAQIFVVYPYQIRVLDRESHEDEWARKVTQPTVGPTVIMPKAGVVHSSGVQAGVVHSTTRVEV